MTAEQALGAGGLARLYGQCRTSALIAAARLDPVIVRIPPFRPVVFGFFRNI
jgi:hypothetical protein